MAEVIRLRIQGRTKGGGRRGADADPLLKAAGICSGAVMSADIDEQLYGEGA